MIKKSLLFIFMLFIVFRVYSDETYGNMVDERKYNSAMEYLESKDPEDKDMFFIDLKVNHFLDYYAQSINHTLFGLKDLENDETIEQVRTNGGTFSIYSYNIPEVLSKFIDTEYESIVKRDLIKYFISLYKNYKYTDEYSDPIAEAMRYMDSIDLNMIYVEDVAYLGLYFLQNKDIDNAIRFYKVALLKKPSNPEYNYNIAYAYVIKNEYTNAMPFIKKAYEGYGNKQRKQDAYLMLGDVYLYSEAYDEAIKIFNEINKESPNLFIERKIIQANILKKELELASELTVEYLLKIQAQESPIYKLANSFIEINAYEKFIDYSSISIYRYDRNHERNAMIYYYQSYVYYRSGDSAKQNELLLKAKNELEKLQEYDGDLMKRITDIIG